MNKDLVYWSLIYKIWGIKGTKLLYKLLPLVKGEKLWLMNRKDIIHNLPFIPEDFIDELVYKRKRTSFNDYAATISNLKVEIISFLDNIYPESLKNIAYPPPLLHIRGGLLKKNLSIAIVGARKASIYGKKVAQDMAEKLSKSDILVVSGMARGIDTYAHKGALLGRGGTIAILGSGIDVIYPRENISLYRDIIESNKGAVISEFPLGTPPFKHNFPMRNRIISGLAQGILVVEASEKSGSLITVEQGLEQGKDVFVIPGQITNPLAKGCHKLIKEGAKLVDSIDDILDEYGQMNFLFEAEEKKENLSDLEYALMSIIKENPLTSEEINKKLDIPLNKIISLLTMLEIKGYVKQLPGRKFFCIN